MNSGSRRSALPSRTLLPGLLDDPDPRAVLPVRAVTVGESCGYLTDFRTTSGTEAELQRLFSGCRRLVCENNYGDADAEAALRNNHMTSSSVGELASKPGPECLVVFHLTDKYDVAGWKRLLDEVRSRFPHEWAAVFEPAASGVSPGNALTST